MTSKPMNNLAFVTNEATGAHTQHGQHTWNPGYNPSGQSVAVCYSPPMGVSGSQHTAVQMTAPGTGPQQPMGTVEENLHKKTTRQTTISLVLSTLNSVFCFAWAMWCGPMAIVLSWKARLQVLDRKYAHARHTVIVSWIVNGLGLLIGLAVWGTIIWMITLATRSR